PASMRPRRKVPRRYGARADPRRLVHGASMRPQRKVPRRWRARRLSITTPEACFNEAATKGAVEVCSRLETLLRHGDRASMRRRHFRRGAHVAEMTIYHPLFQLQ